LPLGKVGKIRRPPVDCNVGKVESIPLNRGFVSVVRRQFVFSVKDRRHQATGTD
jgi:hypothetical protein